MNEKGLAGLEACAITQGTPRRGVWHIHRSALRKAQMIRKRMHLMGFAHCLLRVGAKIHASGSATNVHPAPRNEVTNIVAYLFDHAGSISARRVRQRSVRVFPGAHVSVLG